MKRRRVLTFVSFLLAVVFTASVGAKTTIKVYHRNETREVQWLKEIEIEFEEAHPDIDLDLIEGIGGGGHGYAERLAVLWAGGSAPDVFYGSTDKAGYILNGWALDVSEYLKRDKKEMGLDDFFPGVFEASTRNGRNMGVPAIAMAQSIFYNKRLFAEAGLAPPPTDWNDPGWDWSDFVACCRKLTRFDEESRAIQAGVGEVNVNDFLWNHGGDRFPAEAYSTGIAEYMTLVNAANIEAYTRVQDLYVHRGYSAAGPRSAVSGWDGFWNGTVAMDWSGWWKVRNYLEVKAAGGMPFEWGIAPVPRVENRANTRWSDPWFIASITKHPDEAWEFVKYVTSRQGQISYARFVAFPPSRQSVLPAFLETIESASGMSRSEALTALSGALQHSRAAQDEIIGGTSVIQQILDEELQPMLQGERDVRQALEAAERRANIALRDLAEGWRQ